MSTEEQAKPVDTTMDQYRIRPLLKKDQRVVSGLLSKLADQFSRDNIREVISSANEIAMAGDDGESGKAHVIEVFVRIFRDCMTMLREDVEAWFADLIGVTPEQYQELPIDIDMHVMNQLQEAPEVQRFFTGASRLFNGTDVFERLATRLRDAYGTATDLAQEESTD